MSVEKFIEASTFKPVGSNAIKISVPISAAYDLEKMQKIQRELLGKLGCPACHSGWDIRVDMQREFLVDAALNVKDL